MPPLPSVLVSTRIPGRRGRRSTAERIEILDLVAIDRVLNKQAAIGTLTPAERREAIRQAFERGLGYNQVYDVFRCSGATVRAALDEPISLVPAR